MKISYFVFTSGEDGENIMDWGVKHSSASLGNRKTLDNEYQSLLAEFGMPPSLEIPHGNSVNILLLPYNNGSALLGYVFPLTDHKGRPNTSSILCVIPPSLQDNRVREIARRIWGSNDLREISKHGTVRPDRLKISDSLATGGTYPFVIRNWPKDDTGYFSANSNIRVLDRVAVEVEPDEPIQEEVRSEKKHSRLIVALIAVIVVVVAGIGWVREYQQRKTEEARIAQAREEQERQDEAQRAREAEEARIARENQEQELSRLERRLNDAEGYLSDAVSAGSAKFMASNILTSLNKINILEDFTSRVSAARSKAEGIINRADDIIRSAEEARVRQAEEEAQRRKEAESQRIRRISDSIISKVKAIPEIAGFQIEHADNVLPPSSDEIDTPLGKMNVCRIDDESSLLDVEALKKILMSFCGEKYVSNNPGKYFVFALKGSKSQWEDSLLSLKSERSEAFVNIRSIKPSSVSSPINIEDYVTRTVTSSGQQNFRLFFKGEGGKYIIVFANSSGSPELYLGTRGNVQRVRKGKFLSALMDYTEISEMTGIVFKFKDEDKELETLDVDGKFELFIRQLVAISGGGLSD